MTYPPYRDYGVEVVPGTRPIWLYLRLSNSHRGAHDSIERQRLDLVRKLSGDGWTVMGEYVDNDSASSAATRSRRGFQALNQAVAAGRVTAIGFWKLDRVHRVASRTLAWVGQCRAQRVTLVSFLDSAEELRYVSTTAKLVIGVKALIAEAETDTMSVRQRAAKAHAAEAGFTHGGTRPFGWQSGPPEVDQHGRSGRRLIAHPVEFPALCDAVHAAIGGASLTAIAVLLAEQRGITAADGRPVRVSSVRSFLRSPRLMGYRLRSVPEHERGVRIDPLDYVVRDPVGHPLVANEPVCDPPTWRRLQEALDSRATRARRPWGSNTGILAGLMVCGSCGTAMVAAQTSNAGGQTVATYKCTARRSKGLSDCRGCSIRQPIADDYVISWLAERVTDQRVRRSAMNRAEHLAPGLGAALVEDLHETLLDLQLLTDAKRDQFGRMRTDIDSMIAEDERRRHTLDQQIRTIVPSAADLPSATAAEAALTGTDQQIKRDAVSLLLQRIEVGPGRRDPAKRLRPVPSWRP